MGEVPVWFERRFDLTFPVGLFPNICARLRGTPARLEELLGGRSAGTLTRQPQQGWTAQEHAGHLLDLEPLWLVRVEDYVQGHTQLTPTDLRNRKTDDANHNARPLEQILAAFRQERQKLLHRVTQLEPALHSRTIPHPRLQTPMRLADHLFFVAEHDDHHLAHIWELIRSANLSA
jgi:uncharacterized damage-inducible protein DinB